MPALVRSELMFGGTVFHGARRGRDPIAGSRVDLSFTQHRDGQATPILIRVAFHRRRLAWVERLSVLAPVRHRDYMRIFAQCPHASDVRGFHAWLQAGRVVRKGQRAIEIVATVMGGDDGGKVVKIKPAYVADVTQTDERTPRAAAA